MVGCDNTLSPVSTDNSDNQDAAHDYTDTGSTDRDTTTDAPCSFALTLCDTQCTDTSNDPLNCGGCGTKCDNDLICIDGQCVIDCESVAGGSLGDPYLCDDECVDLDTAEDHCGACGEACDLEEECILGSCSPRCSTGETWCPSSSEAGNGDEEEDEGECADLTSAHQHCGECDRPCADGEACSARACQLSCDTGLLLCSGGCVDIATSEHHCGRCNNECDPGLACEDGACRLVCPTGLVECSSTCVDTTQDPFNCGSCSIRCPSNSECRDGQCRRQVSSVSIDKVSINLIPGQSITLVATVYPSDAFNKAVVWTSSSPSIATVNGSGTVTGVGQGEAVITVITVDGEHRATCLAKVTTPVSGVSLNKTNASITPGESLPLVATISPANATTSTVNWSSSTPQVASVDSNGLVTAISEGQTTIQVTTVDGGHTATCSVSVVLFPVTSVTVRPERLNLRKGQQSLLVATVSPSDASDKTVFWLSANPQVATVSNTGLVVAMDKGNTTVSAITVDGAHTDTCAVSVSIPVTYIEIDQTELRLEKNTSTTLTATVVPPDASNPDVTWSSDNTAVAEVNQEGRVFAAGIGAATITATSTDGGYTADCTVTVWETPVQGVQLHPSSLAMLPGTSSQLTATVLPNNATNQTVSWLSDNPGVASVDDNGLVTAHTYGDATVRVITEDGPHSATAQIAVIQPVTGITIEPQELALKPGNEAVLTATVLPLDATDRRIAWSSSNSAVAIVAAAGDGSAPEDTAPTARVTAIAWGEASITATTEDGGLVAACAITVTDTLNIRVVSQGYPGPFREDVGIWVNGEHLNTGGRSYMVMVVDKASHNIDGINIYDVFGDIALADQMANGLNALSADKLIVVQTYDEPQRNRFGNNNVLLNAMLRCGASMGKFGSNSMPYRGTYILAGTPSQNTPSAYEWMGSLGDNPNAWIEASFRVINGVLAPAD